MAHPVTNDAHENTEERVLVLVPTNKDAELTISLLARAGIWCLRCQDLQHLCAELEAGAGAALLPEEVIGRPQESCLTEWLARQPAWSDLPILVLARRGADSPTIAQVMEMLHNATVLERPTRMSALVSAVRVALRARRWQYELRKQISDLQQAEESLRDADRRKDEFLAMLAHELRNPLAPIRNSVHILRLTGNQDPAAERVGEMIERQVNHLVRLVDDLLEVSRITRGKIELRKEVVELAAIVRSALEQSRPHIESAGHQFAMAIPPEPLMLHGDPVRLAEVVANLLNNAAKYTPAGGQIWLSARRDDQSVVLSVRDNGFGMVPEMLPRVFELFTQGGRESHQVQGGLGIGLTLVKSLVEMHGGSVEAHSAGAGQGSEFIVRLPLAAAGGVADRPAMPIRRSPALPPRRVLVVDDNRDAAESLGMLLKVLGSEVQIVFSGRDALEAMATFRPAVVLLDIGMPDMDGYEVAQRIREQPRFEDVTLIAMTGWGQERDRERSQAAGINHHLVKPADLATLESLLNSPGDSTMSATADV